MILSTALKVGKAAAAFFVIFKKFHFWGSNSSSICFWSLVFDKTFTLADGVFEYHHEGFHEELCSRMLYIFYVIFTIFHVF